MDKKAFNYSVIRFLPEKSLGEFVNIGIVLKCSKAHYLGCKIQPWTQRASHFFRNVDRGFYTYATKALQDELKNIKEKLDQQENNIPLLKDDLDMIFNAIVKPYDSAIQFSPVFSGISEDLDAELEYLHNKYVLSHIEGASKDKIDSPRIEKRVKDILRNECLISSFKEMEIKCTYFSHKFPLAHKNGGAPYILQPLSLDIEDEKDINDAAYKWFGRLESLKSENVFTITMVIAPPRQEKLQNHFEHAVSIIKKNADDVVLINEFEGYGKNLKQRIKSCTS